MKTKLLVLLSVLICLFPACKKAATQEAQPTHTGLTGLVCGPGTSLGSQVTKEIGPQGGTLESADGTVRIDVPAGALSAPITIGIEPYTNTNTNPAQLGIAYRITPHGQQFDKPVNITFNYEAYKDSVCSPEVLRIAYQKDDGIWYMMGNTAIDTLHKTLTYQSNHFSTWTMMPWLLLSPISADLSEDEEITLKAQRYVEDTDSDDLFVPLPVPKAYPVGIAIPLESKYIKAWHLSGGGTLIPTTGAEAVYKAPAAIPAGNYTSAVSVELQSATHKLFLVSNMQLKSKDFFEMKVAGGNWTRFDAKCVSMGPGQLGIASIGDHYTLSIFWPATGKGSYPWSTEDGGGSVLVGYNYIVNDLANYYMSKFEDQNGQHYSGGAMIITEYGKVGEYISGSFTLSPSGYYNLSDGKQVGTPTIQGRFRLKRAL